MSPDAQLGAPKPSLDRALIEQTMRSVGEPDPDAAAAARAALDAKTKPRGSLGRLEDLACTVAAIRGAAQPGRLEPAVVVCAADHGVADESVSAYPQEVTGQMLRTFAHDGAAICVLAREAGARLVLADLGAWTRSKDRGSWTAECALAPLTPPGVLQ